MALYKPLLERRPRRRGRAWLLPVFVVFAGLAGGLNLAQAEDAPPPPPPHPTHIQADSLTFHEATQVYEGKGAVVVVQGPTRLEADEATLNVATGDLVATGQVHFSDGVTDLRGDRLELNLNTTRGVIFHGRLLVLDGNFTLDGRVLERLSETEYRVEAGSFTTCTVTPGERTPWKFKAAEADLEVEGFLYARHARFCILDLPVFYLPVVLFPAKKERASGLLFPNIGVSSLQGLKIRQAFFWAISPSQDATLAVDYRGKLGLGGELEYRYVPSRRSTGRLYTRFFRDTSNQVDRWDLLYRHSTRFSEDLQGRVDVNYLSQKNTLQVLSENVLQRVAVFMESQAYLTRRWDNHLLYGLGRYSQNLAATNDPTPQILPQIGYSLLPARLGGLPLYVGIDTTLDNFHRQQGLDGSRIDLFPRLWAPLSLDRYVTVTPQVGFRETAYSRGLHSQDPVSREVPYLSTAVDSRLIRRFGQGAAGGIVHKIEPTVIYEYLPSTPQADLPEFNELDRLTRKNLLTYLVTNRFSTMVTDGDVRRYLEFGYLRLTQSQHLGSSPTGQPFSDLRAELILRTVKPLLATLDIDTFYNHSRSALSVVNTDLRVDFPGGYFFTVGQRFTQAGTVPVRGDLFYPFSMNQTLLQAETTHFYAAEAGVALPYNLYAVARGYYDQKNRVFPEVNYGLYYVGADRCWGGGVLLIQRPEPLGLEYAFVFTLGGVGFTDSPFAAIYRSLFARLGLDIQKLR